MLGVPSACICKLWVLHNVLQTEYHRHSSLYNQVLMWCEAKVCLLHVYNVHTFLVQGESVLYSPQQSLLV